MKTTVNSREYKNILADFDVLVDPKPRHGRQPAMAILVEPKNGDKFLLPMDLGVARDLSVMLMETVMKVKPELFAELFA